MPQQIGLEIDCLSKTAECLHWADSLYPHFSHQTSYTPFSDLVVMKPKIIRHAKDAFCRILKMGSVYLTHNFHILCAFPFGDIITDTSAKAQNLTLLRDADLAVGID